MATWDKDKLIHPLALRWSNEGAVSPNKEQSVKWDPDIYEIVLIRQGELVLRRKDQENRGKKDENPML